LEQNAVDEFWNNRSNLDLHIPFLSGDPRMHWHILDRKLNLDGQTAKLTTLPRPSPTGTVHTSSDGAVLFGCKRRGQQPSSHCPDVICRRFYQSPMAFTPIGPNPPNC